MNNFAALLFRFSFGLLCHSLLLPFITDCRYGKRICRWVWLGTAGAGSVLAIPLIALVKNVGALFVAEAFFTLFLYGGVCVFLSEGSRLRSLFAFSVYGTYFIFLLTFASCLSQTFFAGSHYATAAIRTVFLAFYGLFLHFGPAMDSFRKTSDLEMGWRSPAIFSCASCLTVYITALTFAILQVAVGIRLAVSAALFILITSAYVVAARTIALLNREREFQTVENQRILLENQLAAEREFVAQAKAYRHDMRHHTTLLIDYLERKDYGGMMDYLAQFQIQLNADALEAYCENHVADALLRLTARRCREGGIHLGIQAVVPETLCLSGPELTTVLGNVLENAWESCRSADKPHMSVTAQVRDSSLLVEVENTVEHPSRFENELPVTTKPGGMLRCFRQGDVFYTQMTIPL